LERFVKFSTFSTAYLKRPGVELPGTCKPAAQYEAYVWRFAGLATAGELGRALEENGLHA